MTGSLRAVETLSRVDPEFVELVDVLYGGELDAEAIWEDVFCKVDTPTNPRGRLQAVSKLSEERKRKIAVATNTAGAVGGPAAIYAAYKNRKTGGIPRDIARTVAGKRPSGATARAVRALDTPGGRKAKIAAGTAAVGGVGLQTANWAGDAIAASMLKDKKGKKPVEKMLMFDEVEKFALPKSVKRVSDGILMRTKGQVKAPSTGAVQGPSRPPTGTQTAKPISGNYQRAGRNAGTLVAGGAVGAGAFAAGSNSGRKKTEAAYGITKADAPEITWAGEFSKFDEDKRLAFGWASVVEKDGLPVVDRQGDYIAPEDMETAAYVYVQKSRVGGDMHRRDHQDQAVKASDLVESVVFTKEKIAKMGLPASTPIGWWVGFKVHDEEVWEQVKKGGRTGFSIHGRGRRRETTVDDVMKEHR